MMSNDTSGLPAVAILGREGAERVWSCAVFTWSGTQVRLSTRSSWDVVASCHSRPRLTCEGDDQRITYSPEAIGVC
jgi:hypothetical protein